MPTTVVNCRTDAYDVYIGRPSRFGNPFKIGLDGTREEVIEKYRNWRMAPEQAKFRADVQIELRGKRLGCYCKPLACHGDVLAEIAEQPVYKVPITHCRCETLRPEDHILAGIKDGFPLCCIAQYVSDRFNHETHDSALFRDIGYSETGKCQYVLCWDCIDATRKAQVPHQPLLF